MVKIKVDLLIKNAKVFNSYLKVFKKADVSVLNGRFYYIDNKGEYEYDAGRVLNAAGKLMIPGLIDIHMHIESSMVTPGPFCRRIAECGVTSIVSEPHEIANVSGIDGVRCMVKAAEDALIDVYYGIPSSVPSTSKELETTGGIIDFDDMVALKGEGRVICVGEIMNYSQIIKPNNLEITRFLEYLEENDPHYIIEGHCPKLLGLDLAKFLYLGINGDHTEHNLEEMAARFENGMFMELQHKTTRKEILDYVVANKLYEHMAFVTDDTLPDIFVEKGHLNVIVDEALRLGFPKEEAIYCSTFTPARRMNLTDRGAIAPGKLADFVLLNDNDLASLDIAATYKRGECIFGGEFEKNLACDYQFPEEYYHSVRIGELTAGDFAIRVDEEVNEVNVRVMEVNPENNHTRNIVKKLPVKDHQVQWENSGLALVAVLERYGKNGNIALGFAGGTTIKSGAVATTYAHDHHNLMVQGTNVRDMLAAVNRLKELQGGLCISLDNEIKAELQLNIGGILSDKPVAEVGAALKRVRSAMSLQGYEHYNSIMNLCVLSLPVSPELKISDKGLIDVEKGEIVPLYTV